MNKLYYIYGMVTCTNKIELYFKLKEVLQKVSQKTMSMDHHHE